MYSDWESPIQGLDALTLLRTIPRVRLQNCSKGHRQGDPEPQRVQQFAHDHIASSRGTHCGLEPRNPGLRSPRLSPKIHTTLPFPENNPPPLFWNSPGIDSVPGHPLGSPLVRVCAESRQVPAGLKSPSTHHADAAGFPRPRLLPAVLFSAPLGILQNRKIRPKSCLLKAN